jgi:hypothetical protein
VTVATEWEVLPGLPATGPLAEPFSATGLGTHSEGLVVRFVPELESPWTGNFQPGLGGASGVFNHPNGRDIIVVSMGQAYIVDPQSRKLVAAFGGSLSFVLSVPELSMLVFADGVAFETIGPSGPMWRSVRVSWDGFRAFERRELSLHGEAYSPLDDQWHPFVLDLRSGSVEGAVYGTGKRLT